MHHRCGLMCWEYLAFTFLGMSATCSCHSPGWSLCSATVVAKAATVVTKAATVVAKAATVVAKAVTETDTGLYRL